MEVLEFPIARLEINERFTPYFYLLNARNVKNIAGRENGKILKQLDEFQLFLS